MALIPAETVYLGSLMIGVWISFILYGWALEGIKGGEFGDEKERFTSDSFIMLLQSSCNTLIAGTVLLATGTGSIAKKLTAGVPQREWLFISLAYMGASRFGIEALSYISYPVQVLIKCCKPIPVLLGEVFLAGERHPPSKYLSIVLLVAGVSLFIFNKPGKAHAGDKPIFELTPESFFGLGLVFCALVCDGIYGPMQNTVKKKFAGLTAHHNMFSMNMIQFIMCTFPFITGSSNLSEVWDFTLRHPTVRPMLMWLALTMGLGNLFIYKLQNEFGALTVTTTTTLRKLASIMFSVFYFGHQMALLQWLAVVVVVTSGSVSKMLLPGKPKVTDTKKD
eukprot:m.202608 g.202608  ORF g.202608 m.202608 type:complete len:336 (+) comp32833_c4_seq1:39-1046(+)